MWPVHYIQSLEVVWFVCKKKEENISNLIQVHIQISECITFSKNDLKLKYKCNCEHFYIYFQQEKTAY